MKRREFITLISGAAAWPVVARAQQVVNVWRIGILDTATRELNKDILALFKGLRTFGYIEGQNLIVEYRSAEGRNERLPELSVYAGCNTRFRDEEDVKKPILMLHGTADDLTPIAPCREYAERLSKAGKSARIIEYPDAYHQFDAPVYRTALRVEQGLTPDDAVLKKARMA
jgi:acetyl esterase/lipase